MLIKYIMEQKIATVNQLNGKNCLQLEITAFVADFLENDSAEGSPVKGKLK